VVRVLLPKVFVIENVPQFITGKNISIKSYIQRSIKRINNLEGTNYKLTFIKINSADYGVPQQRERLFIIGNRNGKSFSKPSEKFTSKERQKDMCIPSYRTSWDAIGHLTVKEIDKKFTEIGGKWGHLLTTIPAGQNYLWHTERGGGKAIFEWRSRYWNFLLKLHPDLPSWTIAANPGQNTGPFHWENRRLTIKELKLLQTIPANYKLCGSLTSQRKQIGNGIPSALGELFGKEIRKQFFNDKEFSEDLRLIPRKRRNIQLSKEVTCV
jgi:DNA (cytosine-5)-methyltransferase 1